MDLLDYIKLNGGSGKINCPVLVQLATRAVCSHKTLYMIALGHKRAGHQLVKSLERVTNGAVSRYQLRPDIFGTPPTGHRQEVSDAA
ncbi:hypothetical protein AOT81_11920 [Xylella fastidiosa]|nr:YdaS family helix-turn-helix protein [Xylella fastidiosa]KQH72802.1 hypothetical protein AOT81_11920 [Xylella fastidiosa]